jgi:four helix bundle protein
VVERKNKNRGYQQLRVWQDAITLYVETCQLFKSWPFEMKRVGGQAIASADSVHRNIAEGYCRRSIREYIQHLYIALGSLGEASLKGRILSEAVRPPSTSGRWSTRSMAKHVGVSKATVQRV